MAHFLVAFASSEGQTEKIAHHIARRLEDAGHLSRLVDLKAGETEAGADDCDAAILAGSMHRSRHDPVLASFIMRHTVALHRIPTAFVSVSLTAASKDDKERRALDEVVHAFFHDVGWQPDQIEFAAGAVHDREVGPVERLALHVIVDAHGVERHPSGNTELTDWPKLDSFVASFAGKVIEPAGAQS